MTIAVFGEALIDFLPDAKGNYTPHLGGSPYNIAIGLARQNRSVSYLAPLSDDSFGDTLYSSLRGENVQVSMDRRSQRPTSIALVTTKPDGRNAFKLYREGVADKDITFAEIKAHLPPDLQLLHTGSLAITPSQLPKIRALMQLMNQRGIPVSMDINIRLGASRDQEAYLAGVRSLLPFADIVKASDEDLAPFQFSTVAEQAAELAFHEQRRGMLVLTQGSADTVLYTASGALRRAPSVVDVIQDTIGAGDSFYAAFLACLGRKQPYHLAALHNPIEVIGVNALQQILGFANAAAAINLSRPGCSPPTQIEVEEFLYSNSGENLGQ
jgi:fructokinase